MKKRILSIVIVLVMTIGFMPTIVFASTIEFAGGSGTDIDPYLISNKVQFDNVRNHLDSHFKLICDIEFSDEDFDINGDFYNDGKGFIPIGTQNIPFTGVFDGNGYAIKNLLINFLFDYSGAVGLFVCNKGTVKNLGILNGSISATVNYKYYAGRVGGFVGTNYGIVSNCYNTCTISASNVSSENASAAGIVAVNAGTIKNCYNLGSINSDKYSCGITVQAGGSIVEYCYNAGEMTSGLGAAGIVGDSIKSTITNCYNSGNIKGTKYSAGIAIFSKGVISNCYNSGNIYSDSSNYVGGIAGFSSVLLDFNNIITNCYNLGIVKGKDNYGAIVGTISRMQGSSYSNTITNCYFLDSGLQGYAVNEDLLSIVEIKKCTEEQLKQQTTFLGFDFENVWMFENDSSYKYPVLRNIEYFPVFNISSNKTYKLFTDALDEAKSGETIKITGNVSIDNTSINEGVTLDLNGNTLTANRLVGYNGSAIVDNSAKKTGRLHIDKSKAIFAKDNPQLAVYDSENGCFAFAEIRTKSGDGSDRFRLDYDDNTGLYTYSVSPVFGENEDARGLVHKLLNQTKNLSGVTVEVFITWENESNTEKRSYEYNDSTVKNIVNSFNVNNYSAKFGAIFKWSDITDAKNAKISTVIRTDTNIEIQSDIIDITIE